MTALGFVYIRNETVVRIPRSASVVARLFRGGGFFTIGNQIPASEEAGYKNPRHY
jgi:hypothetical protein